MAKKWLTLRQSGETHICVFSGLKFNTEQSKIRIGPNCRVCFCLFLLLVWAYYSRKLNLKQKKKKKTDLAKIAVVLSWQIYSSCWKVLVVLLHFLSIILFRKSRATANNKHNTTRRCMFFYFLDVFIRVVILG